MVADVDTDGHINGREEVAAREKVGCNGEASPEPGEKVEGRFVDKLVDYGI